MSDSPNEITRLLIAWSQGDKSALDVLVPAVHDEMRRLARRYMRQERGQRALETTELVNELYLKLVDCSRVQWRDRAHFFAISAQLLRRILVDTARSRGYAKRGGDAIHVTFEQALNTTASTPPDWLALDDALNALETVDPRKCRIVELRFFGGLDIRETAEVLSISTATVERDWSFARAWLRRELVRGQDA